MPLLEALGLELTAQMRQDAAAALKGAAEALKGKGRMPLGQAAAASGAPAAAPDPDKARFDAHWARIGNDVDAMTRVHVEKTWGTLGDGPLTAAKEAFYGHEQEMRKAEAAGRYGEAATLLARVEADLKAIADAFPAQNGQAQAAYEKAKADNAKLLERFDPAVAGHRFGQPPAANFAKAIEVFQKGRALMQQGESEGNYLMANAGLLAVRFTPANVENAVNRQHGEWQTLKAAATPLLAALDAGTFAGIDANPLRTAVATASSRLTDALGDDRWGAVAAAFATLAAAIAAVRGQAARSLLGPAAGKPKAARAKAAAYLKRAPDILKALHAEPGGKAALDAMVADLDGKAKSADDKAFVRSAIEARFGPKLRDADLTTKYPQRLYQALAMVPESHTLTNDKLTEINRTRVKLLPEGDYSYDKDKKKGVINLQTPRTGTVDWLESKAMAMGGDKIVGHLGGRNVSTFDALTLHEVGHAVDEAKGFMNGKVGDAAYGGWKTHKVDEVVAALGEGKAFFKDFASLPRAFLEGYLKALLQKRKPDADAGVQAALAPGARVDWKALAKHAAVDCAGHIRLDGSDSGLWDRGNGGAAKYAIGGRVYQEAYEGQWVSYALAARGQILCDYQFRSPAEWFAEPYAAFFLGKLKPAHPLYTMLKSDQDAGKAAERAAR